MSRVPYQLLELSIISAQDLAPVYKNLRTYAVTWINPDRKLRTRIDQQGLSNPTWNDKFVFRVDDRFLDSETSLVIIEIYAVGWLRDTPVGSVSVLISNLIPPSVRQERRFVALQIRRRSGRPQGILNMGVSLLDNTMRSMPLCTELSGSAVGFQDLSGEKSDKKNNGKENQENVEKEKKQSSDGKKIRLMRSLSDQTDRTKKQGGGKKNNAGSVCNGSVQYYGHSSVATGAGGGSVVDGGFGSVVTNGCSVVNGGSMVNGSVCNSDLGPSPSVVAAAIAWGLYPIQQGPSPKPGSSVLEDWMVEESSVEGLKSKIEQWRMDHPRSYDQGYKRLENSKKREKKRNRRRSRTLDEDDEETRRFSCFGNAYGCEFTIVCGGSSHGGRKNRPRGYTSSKTTVSDLYF